MNENKIPYREGDPPPGEGYIKARVVSEDNPEGELMWVLTEDISKPPLKHDGIDALLPVLRWQWKHLKKYLTNTKCRSFEDWELDFLRERNPVREIAWWSQATYAYLEFCHRSPGVNKEAVFGAITAILAGQPANIKPKSVEKKLRKLFTNPPKAMADVHNFTEDGVFKAGPKHLR